VTGEHVPDFFEDYMSGMSDKHCSAPCATAFGARGGQPRPIHSRADGAVRHRFTPEL